MRLVPRAALASVLFLAATGASPTRAFGDEDLAPALATEGLRVTARAELHELASALSDADAERLVGLYAAFDANPRDPFAMAACDDDGDPVIVLSDAMLRFVANVARAESLDEANGSRRVEGYATFLARAQNADARLLPPPPGFYSADRPETTYEARRDGAISFVLARELVSLRRGDLVCPHPTATKEHGDDVWTAAEQRRALETAAKLHPGSPERDREATERLVAAGHADDGALALTRALATMEEEQAHDTGRWLPTYAKHHPGAEARAETIRGATEAAHEDTPRPP